MARQAKASRARTVRGATKKQTAKTKAARKTAKKAVKTRAAKAAGKAAGKRKAATRTAKQGAGRKATKRATKQAKARAMGTTVRPKPPVEGNPVIVARRLRALPITNGGEQVGPGTREEVND